MTDDLITRQSAVDEVTRFRGYLDDDMIFRLQTAIKRLPTVEPTLYGYKIEHLALIARVMQKDGVTPERAVQIFKDVQTIALKVIDEINGIIERTFEQFAETRGSEDDTAD